MEQKKGHDGSLDPAIPRLAVRRPTSLPVVPLLAKHATQLSGLDPGPGPNLSYIYSERVRVLLFAKAQKKKLLQNFSIF